MTKAGAVCLDREELYHEFMRVNRQLKEALTDWQGHLVSDRWVPNTHDDPFYDSQVLHRLRSLHRQLKTILAKDGTLAETYLPLFDRCMEMIDKGAIEEYLFRAQGSYHSLLWKVHQELAQRAGRKYREDEG